MSKKLKLLPANPEISDLQERRERLNNIVYELAQKDYDKEVLLLAEQEIKQIDRFLSKYSPSKLSNEYSGLPKERKELIVPIAMSNVDYAKIWQEEVYNGKEFMDNAKEYYTRKGERVRSKSEIIIANMLNDNNIPYRYEYPLEMKNGIRIYPDFTVLNMRTREVKYLEHLGMMDKIGYYNYNLNKIGILEQNGYLLGVNLLILHETSDSPINILTFRRYVEEYLI